MSVTETMQPSTSAARLRLPLFFTLALRELRGGLKGFYVFVACIALGVAVIAGVGSLADAMRNSFERQGETLLGGDVTMSRPHARLEANDQAWLARQGRVSETATVRAMARRLDGEEQAFVEVKGIDRPYPLVGALRLKDGARPADVVARGGAMVDPIILERLRLKPGDRMTVGKIEVPIGGVIEAEPDRMLERLTVGPRVMIGIDQLVQSGLADPGSLVSWRYALKLADVNRTGETGLVVFRDELKKALPESGFTVRDRRDPSPQVSRTLERLRQFLTLVGLTALLVGGVGVANAVASYIDRRRKVIAVLRSLGATSPLIFGLHLTQVLIIASVGVALGLALGMLIPGIVTWLAGSALPIQAEITVTPGSLVLAAAYGFLVALLFTLWPLGRAELIRPSALFREEVAPERTIPRPRVLILLALVTLGIGALAIFGSESRKIAFYYCLGIAAILALFFGLGHLVAWVARQMPRPRWPALSLAIGNIGAPGGLARSIVLSLGAGLSLLVAVALTDRSIVSELTSRIPAESPSYFVLDLKRADLQPFEELLQREFKEAQVHTAPMLRGRIVRIGDTPTEQVKTRPEHAWVLNGDRGLSYSETVPEGSLVVAGNWWPADYAGEPLVSMEAEIAKSLGLKLGDTITVNILGRNVTARVANLRDVKWESVAINFVMIFSPNTLRAAPHNLLATVTLPQDAPLDAEARIAQRIGREFPAVTAIRVKDAINQFNTIFERVMTAVRAAGSVTLIAGAFVLAGALATAQQRRIKQAVILKTLGATRRQILTSHLVEYGLLAAATSLIAVVIGSLAAWITIGRIMDMTFVFSFRAVAEALALSVGLVALFGGLGTWRVLQARPARELRGE